MADENAPQKSSSQGGLADNIAGALAYFTIFPAILFLVIEPFNKNKFVRFHAFQCLFLAGAGIAISIVLMIIAVVPVLNLVLIIVYPLYGLGFFILVLFLMFKAFNNQKFKVPVIGDIAEKQANAI